MLVSRCGGLDHYIDPACGWVVPVGDVDALTAAISEALDAGPARLEEMGAAARAVASRHFDMSVVGSRYLALFTQLIAGQRVAEAAS